MTRSRKYWVWAAPWEDSQYSFRKCYCPVSSARCFLCHGWGFHIAQPHSPAQGIATCVFSFAPATVPSPLPRGWGQAETGADASLLLGSSFGLQGLSLCQCNGSCGDMANCTRKLSLVKHKSLLLHFSPSRLAAVIFRAWLWVLGMGGLPAFALGCSKLCQLQSGCHALVAPEMKTLA